MDHADQWNKLQNAGQSDENFDGRMKLIYRQFPIEIRDMFATWIDSQQWHDIIEQKDKEERGMRLFNDLIELIKKKTAGQAIVEKIRMKDHIQTLENSFRGNEDDFVETMQQCLREEKTLLESYEQAVGEAVETPGENQFDDQQQEIMKRLAYLRGKIHDLELDVRSQEKEQEQFILRLDQIHTEKNQLTSDVQKNTRQKQKLLQQIGQLQREKEEGCAKLVLKRQELFQNLCQCAMTVEEALGLIWGMIDEFKKQQKLGYTGQAKESDSSVVLDILNTLCGNGSHLVLALSQQVERSVTNFVNLPVENSNATDEMKKLQIGMKTLLKEHLKKSFVIDKQPQRVLKISKGRSLSTSMTVRILGAQELGLHLHPPKVTALLYNEKDGLPEALEIENVKQLDKDKGVCEVINGKNISMEVRKACGHLVANFNSVQLRGVKKIERLAKDERVTEKKHGMVFFTNVTVRGDSYLLKALSLPLVLTSQSSQECAAKGTLLWDAAFSEDPRELYVDPDMVEWHQFSNLLKAYFHKEIGSDGPGLSREHLQYFATRLFGGDMEDDFEKQKLARDKVFKEKVSGREFTFWKWFYACMYLIKDNLKKEWTDKLIHGFMDKTRATNLLLHQNLGTFLLRFSERAIEQRQAATTPGCLCLAVVEMDPMTGKKKVFHVKDHLSAKEIYERGLANILQAMEVKDYQQQGTGAKKQLLTYLEPNMPFDDAFGKYLTEAAGEDNDGYIPTSFKIEIPLAPKCTKPGHCSPASPAISECHSTTTYGVSSPSVASENEESMDLMSLNGHLTSHGTGTSGTGTSAAFPDLLPSMEFCVPGSDLVDMHSDAFGSGSSDNVLNSVLDMEHEVILGFQQNPNVHVSDNMKHQLIAESLHLANSQDHSFENHDTHVAYGYGGDSNVVVQELPHNFQSLSFNTEPGCDLIRSLLQHQPENVNAFNYEVPAVQQEVVIPTTVSDQADVSESD